MGHILRQRPPRCGRRLPEILLYDRLVLPYPPNDEERERWRQKFWDPETLTERIDLLKPDLVVTVPWDENHRARFSETRRELRAVEGIRFDAEQEVRSDLPYKATRIVLSQDSQILRQGEIAPLVVPAYSSLDDIQTDYLLERPGPADDLARLTMLLGRRFVVPAVAQDTEEALKEVLKRVVDLARSPKFRAKRRDLHDWEEQVLGGAYRRTPEQAVAEMDQLVTQYNDAVKAAKVDTRWRFAYVIGGVGIAMAGIVVAAAAGPQTLVGAAVQGTSHDVNADLLRGDGVQAKAN